MQQTSVLVYMRSMSMWEQLTLVGLARRGGSRVLLKSVVKVRGAIVRECADGCCDGNNCGYFDCARE